jgi:branched-chain amino acid aminotransferase
VLAKIEATQLGYKEALMLNMHGEITECTGDNIFIVKDNLICTPPVSAGVLEGVTRDFVLEELASLLNLNVFEKTLKVYDILTADECFLTGTAVEIMPVTELSGAKIGEGKPGNVTKKLINKFYEVLEQFKDKAA